MFLEKRKHNEVISYIIQKHFHSNNVSGSYICMAAFSCKQLNESTAKTGLIAEIAQVITHEVIENEIVDLNVYFSI